MRMWHDPEVGQWRDQWRRRGELLTVAGLTSALSTGATGHLLAVLVGAGVALLGIYTISAADIGWWLPGRKTERRDALQRFRVGALNEVMEQSQPSNPESALRDISSALNRIAEAAESFAPDRDGEVGPHEPGN